LANTSILSGDGLFSCASIDRHGKTLIQLVKKNARTTCQHAYCINKYRWIVNAVAWHPATTLLLSEAINEELTA